jgi:2-dehydropantoate 2-reductase
MNIAVVGCGALGSYYGALLQRAGLNVSFVLRSDFAAVRDHGVTIHSRGQILHARPRAVSHPAEAGPADLVLVALKTTANDQLPHLIPPLLGPATAVVTLQNGLGNEDALARLLPHAQTVPHPRILGGLCIVCVNRVAPGVIHHIDHGHITLGEFSRAADAGTEALASVFRSAGIPCDVTPDLPRARWEKLTWNIPFNGLTIASRAGLEAVRAGRLTPGRPDSPSLTTDLLLADPEWHALVRATLREVIVAARALGHPIDDRLEELQIQRTLTIGAYRPSTLIDFERGLPLELDSLFLEPLRQARAVGLALPRLEALVSVLTALQPPPRQ